MVGPSTRRRQGCKRKTKQAKQKELYVLDYQGETAELEGVNETRPGDELQAVLEATGDINLNGGPQHEMEARTKGENGTAQLEESSKKHPGDELQAAMPTKRVKTEDGVRIDLAATVHSAAMGQETNTPHKTCDKRDSQYVDHISMSGQGEE